MKITVIIMMMIMMKNMKKIKFKNKIQNNQIKGLQEAKINYLTKTEKKLLKVVIMKNLVVVI